MCWADIGSIPPFLCPLFYLELIFLPSLVSITSRLMCDICPSVNRRTGRSGTTYFKNIFLTRTKTTLNLSIQMDHGHTVHPLILQNYTDHQEMTYLRAVFLLLVHNRELLYAR